jgi:hypothetical protein
VDEDRHDHGPGFLTDLRAELRRCWTAPFEVPVVVAVNASLVLVLWWGAPLRIFDAFFTLHGELALPMVLASWMYADVPATNLFGGDAAQMRAALDDPARLRRLMDVKNVALWTFVTPVAVVATLAVTAAYRMGVELPGTPLPADAEVLPLVLITLVWIVVAPLGALGVSAWVGILFPYHPLPLRTRWAHRRPWRTMVVRWAVLVVVPYGVVPALTGLVVLPSVLFWHLFATNGLTQPLTATEFLKGTLLTAACSVGMLVGGRRVALQLVARRRTRLDAYLADPGRG